jgi:hypothetical protein
MVTGVQDFTTCQLDLTRPRTLAQHASGPLVATPGGFYVPGK